MDIYISSSARENIKDTVNLANKLGVNIEVCRFADSNILDNGYEAELNLFVEAFRDFQGKVTLHGTFFDLNPISKDTRIADITIYRYMQSLNTAKTLGANTVVFHTGYNSMVKASIYHDLFIENQIKFWQEFIKKFEDAGITAVLENTYENSPEIITSAINNINSKYLKACIDTGHVNINSNLDVSDWINAFGSNLHHMHLHNNFGNYDDHNSVLSGTLNFETIIKHLKEKNLSPNLILEIFQEQAAVESFEFIKSQISLITSKV